jgi:hypothetical protein
MKRPENQTRVYVKVSGVDLTPFMISSITEIPRYYSGGVRAPASIMGSNLLQTAWLAYVDALSVLTAKARESKDLSDHCVKMFLQDRMTATIKEDEYAVMAVVQVRDGGKVAWVRVYKDGGPEDQSDSPHLAVSAPVLLFQFVLSTTEEGIYHEGS